MTSAGAVQDRQRRVRQAGARQRTNPVAAIVNFMREVRAELRKVAWPTRAEVRQYSLVVLATLVILISLIFVLDYGASKSILYLFNA
jgi:preprotein translocase subunit SecE